jgi:hypothetical protein
MIFGDLRGWIECLRKEGELLEIDAEVDWDRAGRRWRELGFEN